MAETRTPRKKKGKGSRENEKPKTPTSYKTPKSKPHVDIFAKIQDPPYEDYLLREDVSAGLKRGELIKGTLRINQKDYSEAYIDDPCGGPDYFIPLVWGRNRALDGDEVVVQVLPPDKWEPYRRDSKDEEGLFDKILSSLKLVNIKSEDTSLDCSNSITSCVSSNNYVISKSDNIETTPTSDQESTSEHTQSANESVGPTLDGYTSDSSCQSPPEDTPIHPTLIDALYSGTVPENHSLESREKNPCESLVQNGKDLRMFKRTAKVVFILSKGHSRACAGIIKIFNKVKGLGLFSPSDARVPRVAVPLSDLPEDFPKNHGKYQSTLFVCRISEWRKESPFARGRVLRSLGEAGDIEPETASILTEYHVDDEEFPPDVLECLPKLPENGKWKASEEELKKRRDFREECVVSIDPSTARDLDDALHCKELSPGVFEVGVHIADVSHFMDPGTALDKMAADRATSVYLVQRVIPMLPRQLCEDLCSLNPHEEKLTFSVVWRLTLKGELLDEWMGKSVICSRAKLSYEEAQLMIDKPNHSWTKTDFPNISDEASVSLVVRSVVILNRIAKQLRFLRQSRGTLRLDQPKLCFSLDKATGLPNGCHVYQHKESNKLIEEFMLLANMAVARKISKCFPAISLLRRHPPPKSRGVEILRDQCKTLGIVLDLSNAGQLQKSLSKYSARSGDDAIGIMEKQLLTNLCCKTMELARYFCTGCIEEENFLHYALNVPRYTHFTSPIRRYADVIVHRLLSAALDQGPRLALLTEDVEEQAQHCNKKRRNAKIVEENSSNLFLGVFIRECGPLTYPGMVQAVLDKSFDVYIPDLAVIKRIYCEKLPLKEFKYDPPAEGKEPSLLLIWKAEEVKDKKCLVQTLKVFTPVEVLLFNRNKTLQFDAALKPADH